MYVVHKVVLILSVVLQGFASFGCGSNIDGNGKSVPKKCAAHTVETSRRIGIYVQSPASDFFAAQN